MLTYIDFLYFRAIPLLLFTFVLILIVGRFRAVIVRGWLLFAIPIVLFVLPFLDAAPNYGRFIYHCSQLGQVRIYSDIRPTKTIEITSNVSSGCFGECRAVLSTGLVQVEAFSNPNTDYPWMRHRHPSGWYRFSTVSAGQQSCEEQNLERFVSSMPDEVCVVATSIAKPTAHYRHQIVENKKTIAESVVATDLPNPYYLDVRQNRIIDKSTGNSIAQVSDLNFRGGWLLEPNSPFGWFNQRITCENLNSDWAHPGTERFIEQVFAPN